jgi:tetratricopeptide (TPR) repeat protein
MKNKPLLVPRKEVESAHKLYSSGRTDEAIKSIKELNEKYPNQPLLFNLIGACYKEKDQLEGAAKMFRVAVSLEPKYAEAYFNLGSVLNSLDQKDNAIESYKTAIKISPNYFEAHNNLGNLFIELGELELAIESLEWAVAYKHDFAEAYNNLGNAYNDYGKVNKAIDSFRKAISSNPNYAKAFLNLALVFKDLGDKDNFIENIEKALSLNPNWGHAYYHLSRIKKFKGNDPQIDQMKSVLQNESLDSIDRIGLNFALSKVYEDLENHEKQFEYLNEANSLRKKELNYSKEKDQKLFARIKETFESPPSIISLPKSSLENVRPIFIVGMPRSGTSLVHQIIDSHNDVYGMGELNNLNKIVVELLKSFNEKVDKCFSESDLLFLHNQYIDSLPISGIDEKVVVDKMPLNFRYIGFILSAFPEAKVIHMKRDPMATCWSIYKHEFRGNAYSFNQNDIASYFKLYKDLMGFWDELFPNKILNICYEDLTLSQEKETRRILSFCELDWDRNCLNFYENKTTMKTTSSMQVRKKMYQGSSEVWKKYENYLQPLLKGLDIS